MSTNFSRPIPSDLYATTLQAINTALNDLARGLDPDTTGDHTVVPVGATRWNAAARRWERFNGTSWPQLADKFAIAVTSADVAGSTSNLSGGAALSLPIQAAPHATTFIAAPGSTGQALVYGLDAANRPAVLWSPISGMAVASATNATNVSGGSVSSAANVSGATTTNNTDSNFQVLGGSTTAAVITYKRGTVALKAGVDTDGVYRVGGGSDGANYRFQVDGSGNFTARGNVTAFSDERLKVNWRPLPPDFLLRLVSVKAGTYERCDGLLGVRQAGVSAQDLRRLLPEVVEEDGGGALSVAYGQAALVACVVLAREVVSLRRDLAALQPRTGDE